MSFKVYSIGLLLFAFVLVSCKTEKKTPPVAKVLEKSGNPIFNGWYADPEAVVFEDNYWVYPTYSDAFEKQLFFDAFSSPDLVNWTKHERILDTTKISTIYFLEPMIYNARAEIRMIPITISTIMAV